MGLQVTLHPTPGTQSPFPNPTLPLAGGRRPKFRGEKGPHPRPLLCATALLLIVISDPWGYWSVS